MTDALHHPRLHTGTGTLTHTRALQATISTLSDLVRSAEPAVVFSSMASLCVPVFSDTCTVDIVDDQHAAYRISQPRSESTEPPPDIDGDAPARRGSRVSTTFESPSGDSGPSYFGVVVHTWDGRSATASDSAMAQLVCDRAVATITQERLADAAHHALDAAANLQTALRTSRQIGAAIGILMATHKITDDAAFDLMRTASQRTNRKLRDIAEEVMQTGWLDQVHPH